MSHDMPIGQHLLSDTSASLYPTKFNRHTFWCGQSGSGKTYSLGVVLEQILLHTELPMVILDPNSDFVRLAELREQISELLAQELAQRHIRILHSTAGIGEQLKVRYAHMDVRSRAAVLQLDPVHDAEEYNAILRARADLLMHLNEPLPVWLRRSEDPMFHRLATRLENLGVINWDLWSWGEPDVTDVLDAQPDATVVDLGHFDSQAESQAAALAVLDHLWTQRNQRIGRLIVIDEAHNLCRPDPSTQLERLLTNRIIQIAAEGRKYGLWLLLSTQRPSKIHPNVLSQCDNLALMKMSSPRDLVELGQTFGFVPQELLNQAASFQQGQALFAGGFSGEPQLVQLGTRLTQEGGTDVEIRLRNQE